MYRNEMFVGVVLLSLYVFGMVAKNIGITDTIRSSLMGAVAEVAITASVSENPYNTPGSPLYNTYPNAVSGGGGAPSGLVASEPEISITLGSTDITDALGQVVEILTDTTSQSVILPSIINKKNIGALGTASSKVFASRCDIGDYVGKCAMVCTAKSDIWQAYYAEKRLSKISSIWKLVVIVVRSILARSLAFFV